MAERTCPDGKKWDILLRTCYKMSATRKLHPPTEPILTAKTSSGKSTSPPNVLMLSQTLWISVILVTLGSILALTIWIVIFRRQTKARGYYEDPVTEQEVLKKAEPKAKFHPPHSDRNGQTLQRAANGSSSCHQLHPGAQMDPKWEDGFSICREPARHVSKDGNGGLPACSIVADHRVPLPATELGGTALVTTKTVV
ncbi:hypothetical protein ATANTOWER_013555 [Ataeniobius toweri]|uniref:Uncharacterized protein n=1 Tax=Ataeniobius toweri TaxID=208326 RepID=A0ABU7B861_9TELE|nr:hypothetical protein [Ataeniobius toweri]